MAVVDSARELAERIRYARQARGLTQRAVAEAMGYNDHTTVTQIETGKRAVGALELTRLADVLRVTFDWLMTSTPAPIASWRTSLAAGETAVSGSVFDVEMLLEGHAADVEQVADSGCLTVPEPVTVPSSTKTDEDMRAVARSVRAKTLRRRRGPLPAMVGFAERLGLFVWPTTWSDAVERDGATVLLRPGLGAAIVNCGTQASPRLRMTVAHEIGHHILGDEYSPDFAAGIGPARAANEQLIDAFAAELMLPCGEIATQWRKAKGPARDRLIQITFDYRVSWSAAVAQARVADISAAAALDPHDPPLLEDYLRVCGAAPDRDVRKDAMGPEWTKAVIRMRESDLIGPDRAEELLHRGPGGMDVHEPIG